MAFVVRRHRFIAAMLIFPLPLFSGCFGGHFSPARSLTTTVHDDSNLTLVLDHAGGRPLHVKTRFLVDGEEICPPQTIKPYLTRTLRLVEVRVPPGEHTLRVETVNGESAAEATFTAGADAIFGYVTYDGGTLKIAFRDYGPGFV